MYNIIRILTLSIFFLVSCSNKEANKTSSMPVYDFKISQLEQSRILEIIKDNHKIYEIKGENINIQKFSANDDLLGNKSPVAIVDSYSNKGAACCHSYNIFDISKDFKLIQSIETKDSPFEVVAAQEQEKAKILIKDHAFSYFYAPFEKSHTPLVTLSFNGSKFVFDKSKMVQNISAKDFQNILTVTKAKLSKSKDLIAVLEPTVNLIYSGNCDLAWNLLNEIFASWKFADLDAVKLQNEILCCLRNSDFADEIQKINNGKLVFPEKCLEYNHLPETLLGTPVPLVLEVHKVNKY